MSEARYLMWEWYLWSQRTLKLLGFVLVALIAWLYLSGRGLNFHVSTYSIETIEETEEEEGNVKHK